jgi:hypothetical protein
LILERDDEDLTLAEQVSEGLSLSGRMRLTKDGTWPHHAFPADLGFSFSGARDRGHSIASLLSEDLGLGS